MLNAYLPFSRDFLKSFKFKITKEIDSNFTLVIINGYKYKIAENASFFNENIIGFGEYKRKQCCVIENFDKDFEGNHFMSSKSTEEFRTLAGIAKATLSWHKETKYCGRCASKLEFLKEENGKNCINCNRLCFPRLNPAIIVLIKNEDEFLLTRKSEWKKNSYGLVAGFVEYGENLEEAVKREVFEETGLYIKNIKYINSQFWPFPYQLMMGFIAEYKSGEIVIDKKELEIVKWFNKKELPELPPKSSIARFLIDISI